MEPVAFTGHTNSSNGKMSRESWLDRTVRRFQRWNQRWNTPAASRWLACGTFVVSTLLLTLLATHSVGLNSPPPIGGDAVSYDSLGWELAQGRGFSHNLNDPTFLKPYTEVDAAAAHRLASSQSRGPITSRPPLLPFVMAGLNRVWGRQFWAIRLVNIGAMGIVGGLVAWTVCRLVGPVPAVLGVVQFLIVDPRVRVASREILTEALACLLVAVLSLLLVRLQARPKIGVAALAGIVMGLAILLRTMFALWLPVLVLLVWLMPRDEPRSAQPESARREPRPPDEGSGVARAFQSRIGLAAAFLVASAMVFAPWGWRNCRLLDRFMPLGTQGAIELAAGHGETAFARWGMWHNLEQAGFFAAIDAPGQSAVERELARADHSGTQAAAWISEHPLRAMLLPAMKVLQEFRPHMSGDLYVLAFALLGLASVGGTAESRAWNAILLATAFGVAVTWSVAGRFVFPVLYVLHCAAAIGAWNSLIACTLGRALHNDNVPRCA